MVGRSLDELGVTLSWRDLGVLVRRWVRTAGTATSEAALGVVHWSVTDQILATLIDVTQVANWQRAGKKHAPKPKRLPRPWEKGKGQKFGSEPIPIAKFDDWWDSKRKAAKNARWRRASNRLGASGSDS